MKNRRTLGSQTPDGYIPVMDADVIPMGQIVNVDDLIRMDEEKSARAAFELRMMLGKGCVDFARILGILEKKVT